MVRRRCLASFSLVLLVAVPRIASSFQQQYPRIQHHTVEAFSQSGFSFINLALNMPGQRVGVTNAKLATGTSVLLVAWGASP